MTGFAAVNMRADLKKLWAQAFGDAGDYAQMFFTWYPPERYMMVKTVGDTPVSMLTLLPATGRINGREYSGAYIYAVATDSSHRGQGHSTDLLAYAHRYLRAQGKAFSALVPSESSLYGFYEKTGFFKAFDQKILTVSAADTRLQNGMRTDICEMGADDFMDLRRRVLDPQRFHIDWGWPGLAYRIKETAYTGGETLLLKNWQGTAGAVCYENRGRVLVKEILLEGMSFWQAVSALHERYQAQSYELWCAMDLEVPEPGVLNPCGAVCWYDPVVRQQAQQLKKAPYIGLYLD